MDERRAFQEADKVYREEARVAHVDYRVDIVLSDFEKDGFCEQAETFSKDELRAIIAEIGWVVTCNPTGLVREANAGEPHRLLGPYLRSPLLARLARDQDLLRPARDLLRDSVYRYTCTI
jgi:hypothetical protein